MSQIKLFQLPRTSCTVGIPSDWRIEITDNVISLYDPANGVGVLQISYYKPDAKNAEEPLESLMRAFIGESNNCADIKASDMHSQACCIDKAGSYWRYWLFKDNFNLFFLSYNCKSEDCHIEEDTINAIVEFFET